MAATPPSRRIPIVLATRALVSFGSVSRAAGLALPDFGLAAFFIAGVTASVLGAASAWFVLAAVAIGVVCRAIDVESWALFIPGGIAGRVERAFGRRASVAASATCRRRPRCSYLDTSGFAHGRDTCLASAAG